jgi:hypothetical protein
MFVLIKDNLVNKFLMIVQRWLRNSYQSNNYEA